MTRHEFFYTASILFILISSGCKDDSDDTNEDGCDPVAQDCENGTVCERTNTQDTICAAPVLIQGKIIEVSDKAGIDGAMVQALDPNLAPTGKPDVSAGEGTFTLQVPAVRDENGAPVEGNYRLRAQAAGYQLFPSGFRQSLPLDAVSAVETEKGWILESTLSTIELIPLPDSASDFGSISGKIIADECAGIMVVAESGDTGIPGYSDSDCNYSIVNIPPGSYVVSGYAADQQLTSSSTEVTDATDTSGVNLSSSDSPLSTVSGNVQIVNAPGGSVTSVVLAVESTFIDSVARGQVPPGLRAGEISGDFEISGVPDGKYVVLAAFENDDLVRDPDETIGGTQIVHIEVPDPGTGNEIDISEGFKVTEALSVISPGADGPEAVATATPTLEWADDSSEDGYTVAVFDAFGEEIWTEEAPGVSGKKSVTLDYGGPALEPGMYYQFRVISFKDTNDGRTSISTTEDLRGVFFYQP